MPLFWSAVFSIHLPIEMSLMWCRQSKKRSSCNGQAWTAPWKVLPHCNYFCCSNILWWPLRTLVWNHFFWQAIQCKRLAQSSDDIYLLSREYLVLNPCEFLAKVRLFWPDPRMHGSGSRFTVSWQARTGMTQFLAGFVNPGRQTHLCSVPLCAWSGSLGTTSQCFRRSTTLIRQSRQLPSTVNSVQQLEKVKF